MLETGYAGVPGRESARETERGRVSQPQRESKQRQKSAGWGTTCTGADRQDRDRGGMSPLPGAPSCAASRLLSCRRPPGGRAGRQAGERVALEDGLCQEESLPGHRGSPGGAMRRMSARSPAGGTSRARASAASAALRSVRADRPRPRHAPPPAERSP